MIPILIKTIWTFLAIFAFAIYMEVPKKFVLWCAFSSSVCNFIYYIFQPESVILATFLGTVAVALLSHILARCLKGPVTIFLIPSILPVVPGIYLYRAIYQYFFGVKSEAAETLLLTASLTGAIAIAMFLVDSLFAIMKKLTKKAVAAEKTN